MFILNMINFYFAYQINLLKFNFSLKSFYLNLSLMESIYPTSS